MAVWDLQIGVIRGMGAALCLLLTKNEYSVSFYDPGMFRWGRRLFYLVTIGGHRWRQGAETALWRQKPEPGRCSLSRSHAQGYLSHVREDGISSAFLISTPHGSVINKTINALWPHLKKGGGMIDAANEAYHNTERRQQEQVINNLRGYRY